MLCPVEDEHFTGDRLGGNKVGVLGHITRPVHFTLMIDFLDDLDAGLGRDCVTAEFAALVVVVRAVEPICGPAVVALRKVYGSDLEVVLCLPGRVRPEKQPVDSIGLVCRPGSG